MWNSTGIPLVSKPLPEWVAVRDLRPDLLKRDEVRPTQTLESACKFGILGRLAGLDNRPERRRLGRRRLRIKTVKRQFAEVGRNVSDASVGVPRVELLPVSVSEVIAGRVRPRHVVPPVVRRQVDAVQLVVGRDDDATGIEDV